MSTGRTPSMPERNPEGLGAAAEPRPNRAFESVLDSVPGAWFFTRRCGRFAYVNQGACEGLGYTRAELLDRTIFDIDPGMTAEMWQALWAGTLPSEPVTVRARHRRKDGSDFPVEVRASVVSIEGEQLAAAYTVDLTLNERTQATNRRLLAAIEQISEAVVMTDATGRVEYVNPAYERTTGLSAAQVRARPWHGLEVGEDVQLVEGFARVLKEGVAWKGRVMSRRCDGTAYDEEVSVSPIRDDGDQVVGCVAVKRDVTEQLRLEQQLNQALKVEAVGQLARGIAHDFNNLLQVIHGQAHLIGLRIEQDAADPMLSEITEAVGRAASLVRQLLAFSRKGTIEVSELRFDSLVSALYDMLRRLLGEHIQLDWHCSTGPVWMRGNGPQLEQVVVNLCINARDAMPLGGRLQLSLAYAQAEELPGHGHDLHPDATVVLTVRDEGCGMSEEVQRRLFEPFFTTKEPGRGTGLGLATVHAVVQAHGGVIDVGSVPGVGSTFRIFLPVIEPSMAQAIQRRVKRRVDGKGRLALVAEDEPAVRELTARYLQQAGFRVITAQDGVEAEQLLQHSAAELSLAVLDAVMPRKGGQVLYEAMRQRGYARPVVFVTGYDYESLALVADDTCVAILQKPFSEDDLLAQVAQVLGEDVDIA